MAWTIIRSWALLLALSCHDGDEDDKPTPQDTPADTTPSTTGETGQTTPVPTGDTATPPGDVWPLCDHIGRTESITLMGADRLDALGRSVDAADIDGDGCAEVAVAAPWEGYYEPGEGAVYLLAIDGLTSGPIDDESSATWQEPEEKNWVYEVALIPPQIVWITGWGTRDAAGVLTTHKVLAYDLPDAPMLDSVSGSGREGSLDNDVGYPHTANDIEDCSKMGTPTLCAGSASRGPELDFAGAIWLYDAPLQDSRSILDYRTRIFGNDGERAELLEADDDLDGDGLADLAIGAYQAAGTGRVGLVSAPAVGDFLLWDVAYATLDGAIEGGEAGLGLATGDLDGDGHVDVFVGAPLPLADVGHAYVMTGPFTGSRTLDLATVTIQGEVPTQFTGLDGAIGDMDGDGAAELIVGAPHSIYTGTLPGSVAVFPSPAPGTYAVSEAPTLLVSGSTEPDAFGISIAPADLDGDGRLDLAIGAPNDSRAHNLAGSVTLVFGASL